MGRRGMGGDSVPCPSPPTPSACLQKPNQCVKKKETFVRHWVSGPGRCCHIPVGQLGTLKLRAGDVMPSGVKEMESS